MADLLPHLLARGLKGRASGTDERVQAWLADPDVSRRVFGQPLATSLGYYLADYWGFVAGRELPAAGRRTEPNKINRDGV